MLQKSLFCSLAVTSLLSVGWDDHWISSDALQEAAPSSNDTPQTITALPPTEADIANDIPQATIFLPPSEILSAGDAPSAFQPLPLCCGQSPRPMRVTARHIEANGVGYNQGYTTLEGFFTPTEPWRETWVPFLDIRGHIFNDGKKAANLGIGTRYLMTSRIWGVNAYYDYRNTNQQHYNQISLGFESLGKIWDFRLNGYLPVGDKRSPFFHTKFSKFKQNQMIISRKREFALKGANAEVGLHINTFKNIPLYIAAGPYYLTGQGKTTWGGELRAAIDIFDYVRFEGNTSYDSLFKWIGQGQVSVTIPFGNKRQVRQGKSCSCSTPMALSERALQRVDRNEIIPLDRKEQKATAIDPLTGLPYFFVFVNNQSHSNGTIESPYPTLAMAEAASQPGNIIYVFPGDGSAYTTSNVSAGLRLQNNQKLWGSGTSHTMATQYGTITLPSLSNSLPTVTNTFNGGAIITLANNCEIAGMHITGTNVGFGINGTVSGGVIQDNWINISNPSIGSMFAILVSGAGADAPFLIANNQITQVSGGNNCYGIRVVNDSASASYSIIGNQISNITAGLGVALGISVDAENFLFNPFQTSYSIAYNQISSITGPAEAQGIGATYGASFSVFSEISSLSITNNVIYDLSCTTAPSMGIFVETSAGILASPNSIVTMSITGNRISNLSGAGTNTGINVTNETNNIIPCLTLQNNLTSGQITLSNLNSDVNSFNLNTSNSGNSPTPITSGSFGTCSQ